MENERRGAERGGFRARGNLVQTVVSSCRIIFRYYPQKLISARARARARVYVKTCREKVNILLIFIFVAFRCGGRRRR